MTSTSVKRAFGCLAVCTAAAVVLFSRSALAVDAVIHVKSVVEVDGSKPEITLGDLIVPHGVKAETLKAISSVRLADVPRGGETRSFTALGLEQVFRAQLRDVEERTGQKVSLRIPTRVTVVRKSINLSRDVVEKEIRAQLKAICPDCLFEITSLNMPALPASLTDGSSWQVRLRSEMPKGNFSVPLEINDEDGTRRTFWLTGSLIVKRNVPVASRAIGLGERFRPEDFSMQTKDITYATDLAASEGELETSIAARGTSAGQILWKSSLRRELAVKPGDAVKILAGNEEWQISLDGISQASGYVGDLIRVKIPRTQKTISGLLKEKGLVEVQ